MAYFAIVALMATLLGGCGSVALRQGEYLATSLLTNSGFISNQKQRITETTRTQYVNERGETVTKVVYTEHPPTKPTLLNLFLPSTAQSNAKTIAHTTATPMTTLGPKVPVVKEEGGCLWHRDTGWVC